MEFRRVLFRSSAYVFIKNHIRDEKNKFIKISDLQLEYKKFCKENNLTSNSLQTFNKVMESITSGIREQKKILGEGNNKVWINVEYY